MGLSVLLGRRDELNITDEWEWPDEDIPFNCLVFSSPAPLSWPSGMGEWSLERCEKRGDGLPLLSKLFRRSLNRNFSTCWRDSTTVAVKMEWTVLLYNIHLFLIYLFCLPLIFFILLLMIPSYKFVFYFWAFAQGERRKEESIELSWSGEDCMCQRPFRHVRSRSVSLWQYAHAFGVRTLLFLSFHLSQTKCRGCTQMAEQDRQIVMKQMIRGFSQTAKEAGLFSPLQYLNFSQSKAVNVQGRWWLGDRPSWTNGPWLGGWQWGLQYRMNSFVLSTLFLVFFLFLSNSVDLWLIFF